LVRPVQAEALRQAARRQVVLRDPHQKDHRCLGTLLVADGSNAYVLTGNSILPGFDEVAVVMEWDGKEYRGQIEKGYEDLCLIVVPCRQRLAPLRLDEGTGRGCWWNGRLELDTAFKENMDLISNEIRDRGCGVFTLDEARLEVVLAGVNCGVHADLATWMKYWAPGVRRIRPFLEGAIPPWQE
jgi:hypothetical protein